MNAKSLLRSALDAAGNPAINVRVFNDMEKNAQRVYTARFTPETVTKLEALRFNFTGIEDLGPMLDSEDGVTVILNEENKKHGGSLVRIKRSGFQVSVGNEWRHVPGCNLIGIPLGFGKLHIQFMRIEMRDGPVIKVA